MSVNEKGDRESTVLLPSMEPFESDVILLYFNDFNIPPRDVEQLSNSIEGPIMRHTGPVAMLIKLNSLAKQCRECAVLRKAIH